MTEKYYKNKAKEHKGCRMFHTFFGSLFVAGTIIQIQGGDPLSALTGGFSALNILASFHDSRLEILYRGLAEKAAPSDPQKKPACATKHNELNV